MNIGLKNIKPLGAHQKDKYRDPTRRLRHAWNEQNRLYHERPVQRDFVAEAEASIMWSTVTCCYSGIEQAMKCLLQMRGAYDKRHKHHDIGKLFQDLAPEEQNVLRVSYRIYQSLHDYIPIATVDRFLDEIDAGYIPWRYFLLDGLLEDKKPPTTDLGAMLEIWSALCDILMAKVYANPELHTVERKIDHHLEDMFDEAWHSNSDRSLGPRELDDVCQWIRERHAGITINAVADLLYLDAEYQIDQVETPPSTKTRLGALARIVKEKQVDNDFDYFRQRAQRGEIIWNPDENLFERISRSEEIAIRLIESEAEYSYVEERILDPSVKVERIESVPDYIEDFIQPRVKIQYASEDWSLEEEEWMADIGDEEGGNECEGYSCHINGIELIIVLYDSREWIVYRYHNDDVPGVSALLRTYRRGESVRSGRRSKQLSIGGEQKKSSLNAFVNISGTSGERGETDRDGEMEVAD